ncbi:DNA translocase FtsK [Sphingomonas antarctica]|uniref:FtsK/SpoIIIE family DNA translocase n=1 Tax=Sphingomonas antarctica TaxID=2040274 RepID=UPI0039E9E7F9
MASRAEGNWQDAMKRGAVRGGTLTGAVLLLAVTLALGLALLSYRATDGSMNTAAGGATHNWIGVPGAWTADVLLTLFGPASALWLPVSAVLALRLWRDSHPAGWKRQLLGTLLAVALFAAAIGIVVGGEAPGLPAGYGGVIGMLVGKGAASALSLVPDPAWVAPAGWAVAGLFALIATFVWARSLALDEVERAFLFTRRERAARDEIAFDDEPSIVKMPRPAKPALPRAALPETVRSKPVIADRAPARAPNKDRQPSLALRDKYVLPSLDLLTPAPPSTGPALDKASLEKNARLLETVLDTFNVKGEIKEVRPGPVVTMYELEPAPGIKASRVVQLADDIARNMSALSARIATIPGRTVIGIELPNARREAVVLHELIASDAFDDTGGSLPLVLGKNIAGDPVIADLAPMPHLLVAGTTGSGKSVGLNAMICSLLYRLTPDQCRMIMIDPKMLELSSYEDIPHLLAPVVTEPAKAIRALKWAVEQMEDRYRMMASIGVRGLASFNEKVLAAKAKGSKLGRRIQCGYDAETGQPIYEEESLDFEPLPQIVVIVDELADLMMTAGKEVEFLIQRLAQKARAAGIHLIMATQRPSVDVITGVIKANLPTRISFAVTSKIDSRTILGEQGAEQLLGKGDMLYMPGGKQVVRVHGPFVSDEEVKAVADHWRGQGTPDYIMAVTEEPEDGGFDLDGAPTGEDSAEDQLYRKARQLVAESQKASTSWLQRQLRVGYNSAARLIERMETDGLVSRPDHVGRREVLMDTDGRQH